MLTYHVVDVFTDAAFAGNPLAVVLDGEHLTSDQMLALANEFNLSETAFPLRDDEADYLLRIFTPGSELPFAGHPSVGAAWLLHSLGRVATGPVVQRCGAGMLPLTVSAERVELTGGPPSVGEPFDAGPILLAHGVTDAAGSAARVCSTGLRQAFAEAASVDAVRGAHPGGWPDVETVSVFAWDAATRTAYTRVFAGPVGVPEDPATGSAATAFGAWLAATGYVPDGETTYTVLQGVDMGRPSRLDCTVVTRDGAAVECRVAGSVVPVAQGTIREP